MLQQLRFELQIGWIAIDSHLKTVGWQLLLEDACKARVCIGVQVFVCVRVVVVVVVVVVVRKDRE